MNTIYYLIFLKTAICVLINVGTFVQNLRLISNKSIIFIAGRYI